MENRKKGYKQSLSEPTMSDKTIMLDVEDLISLTFGPLETNVVNFTMMETVLNILARQMRFLEDDIEIKFSDDEEQILALMKHYQEEILSLTSKTSVVSEKEILIAKDTFDDYITGDETDRHRESNVIEVRAKQERKSILSRRFEDLEPSKEADDTTETKGEKTQAKRRTKSDDIDKTDEASKTDESVKRDQGKRTIEARQSPSYDKPVYTEGEGKQKTKRKEALKEDHDKTVDESEDEVYKQDKKSPSKKQGKPVKQEAVKDVLSSEESEESEDNVVESGKRRKKKAIKKEKASDDTETSDGSEDISSQKVEKGKDKTFQSKRRRSPEDASISDSSGGHIDEKRLKKSKDKLISQSKKSKEPHVLDSSEDVKERKVQKSKEKSLTPSKKGKLLADVSDSDTSEDVKERKVTKGKDKLQSQTKKGQTREDSSASERSDGRSDETKLKKGGDRKDRQLKKEKRTEGQPIASKSENAMEKKVKKEKRKSKSKKEQIKGGEDSSDISEDLSEREITKTKDKKAFKKGMSDDKTTPSKKIEDDGGKRSKRETPSKQSDNILESAKLTESERSGKRKERKDRDRKMEGTPQKESSGDKLYTSSGITVSEVTRKGGKSPKDKILVVEKGPTTRDSRTRLGKINVVTRSQFELLESDVNEIMKHEVVKPFPIPISPELKEDLRRGSVTLSGTMQAMHVNARVKAAEDALTQMADLLTRLATEGTLPVDACDLIEQLQEERQELSRIISKVIPLKKKASRMSLFPSGKDSGPQPTIEEETHDSSIPAPPTQPVAPSKPVPPVQPKPPIQPVKPARMRQSTQLRQDRASMASDLPPYLTPAGNPLVTRSNLSEAVGIMRTEMLSEMDTMTARSTKTAEQAQNIAKTVVEKLETAMAVSSRIEDLKKFTTEQCELLDGFDTGLTCQMQNFQDQMRSMREELQEGVHKLVRSDRVESSAVTSLREQHDSIELQMDQTIHHHASLVDTSRKMHDELKNLIMWVDLLREEKADREEVEMGLRDKLDINQLIGLLFEDDFEVSRKDLNNRLHKCHEVFNLHSHDWMHVLYQLKIVSRNKAELVNVLSLKSYATECLNEIRIILERAETLMGDPKMAIQTRLLSGNATCGSCRVPALFVPIEWSYAVPPAVPVLPYDDMPIEEESVIVLRPQDTREYTCKRWVGGSHTMIKYPPKVLEKPTRSQLQVIPTRQQPGTGMDGAIYVVEEELQACVECNVVPKEENKTEDNPAMEAGGGDILKPSTVQFTNHNDELDLSKEDNGIGDQRPGDED